MNAPARPADKIFAIIVDAAGVFPVTDMTSARKRLGTDALCWIDIFGGDDTEHKELMSEAGFEDIDIAWAQRFGQAGRMAIGSRKLRDRNRPGSCRLRRS